MRSNSFTTAPWTPVGTLTIVQNALGPDGGVSAWTLTDNGAAGLSNVGQAIALTAATNTYSVFVKKTVGVQSAYPVVSAYISAATSQMAICTIDTSNGIATLWTAYTGFTMAAGASATCENFNNDYWRVSLTRTCVAASYTHDIFPAGTTNPTQSSGIIDNAAVGSAVFYGAQEELGAFPSSYIATFATAIARVADVLTYPSAGNVIGTVGSAYAEITYPDVITSTAAFIGLGNSRPLICLSGTTATIDDGTTSAAGIAMAVSVNRQKLASAWGNSLGKRMALNGVLGTGGVFDGDMSPSVIAIGQSASVQQPFGNVRNAGIYDFAATDAQLETLTS